MMHTPTADEESSLPHSIVTHRAAWMRLAAGLLQGLVLYLLYFTADTRAWPATKAYLFAPLVLISALVPVLFIAGVGHLDPRRLWRWMLLAIVLAGGLAFYDMWRIGAQPASWYGTRHGWWDLTPSGLAMFFIATGFYIAHALVLAAAADRRRIAHYSTYFDVAWKLAIQLLFSILFVCLLWLILWLGAALFMLVKLDFFQQLMKKSWFHIPVTALAFAMALHITDVRPGIVRGIRNLLLVLMSWLLPIATIIVAGFLAALPFAGLEPLWATRHASAVLLSTAAVLIVLINASFQSGEVSQQVARVLRIAARVACVLLLPIVAIAVYALALRVQQYGWTTDRVYAAACLLLATCYASGYLWAALERDAWLHRIAPTNVATAFIVLAVLLALFTPIADPARLAVNNQLARLETGKVSAKEFDFEHLKFDGARYGKAALEDLKATTAGIDAKALRAGADAALQKKNRWDRSEVAMAASDIAANLSVLPKDKALPVSFLAQDWKKTKQHMLPDCMTAQNKKCDAYQIDLSGDGKAEVLLHNKEGYQRLTVFTAGANGEWRVAGDVHNQDLRCLPLTQALAEGSYRIVPPDLNDIEVAGKRLHFNPSTESETGCEKK